MGYGGSVMQMSYTGSMVTPPFSTSTAPETGVIIVKAPPFLPPKKEDKKKQDEMLSPFNSP